MIATCIITEISYRFIETPIRTGTVRDSWGRLSRSPSTGARNAVLATAVVFSAFAVFAGVSLATADVVESEVQQSLDEAASSTCDVVNDPNCDGVDDATVTEPVDTAPTGTATDPNGSAVVVPPVETTTSTTMAPAPIAQIALGDSVMKGAAPALSDKGFVVDAVESRQFTNGADTAVALSQQGRLGDVVVVHLGTNGTIEPSDMTRMMEAFAGVPQVLLLTVDVDRSWTAGNNAVIYDTVNTYPNAFLLDWAGLDDSCPGDCFYSDGIHLKTDGQQYYADLIAGALQTPG
jgi:lysophospholipase L1-like esterase